MNPISKTWTCTRAAVFHPRLLCMYGLHKTNAHLPLQAHAKIVKWRTNEIVNEEGGKVKWSFELTNPFVSRAEEEEIVGRLVRISATFPV